MSQEVTNFLFAHLRMKPNRLLAHFKYLFGLRCKGGRQNRPRFKCHTETLVEISRESNSILQLVSMEQRD